MFMFTIRGNLDLPRLLLPPFTFGIVIYLIVIGEGIRDEGVLGLALVIALAGLLNGRMSAFIYTIAGIIAITIIGLVQINGWIPNLAKIPIYTSRIIITDILLFFLGAVICITIDNLEYMLKTLHQREAELEQSNLALTQAQSELEERIAERVRSLSTAREEAEAAREEIENQAWLTTGSAKLSDEIRGEQEIPELSSKIIRHLCSYLDAQVGAIFWLDENNILRQTGAYAFSGIQQSSFEIGESIIGQAAQNKETILMNDIPADLIRISSGLSDIPPKYVVAVPILFDDEVVGVFEIGSLHPFSQQQLQFLESTTESIGIAFHTAQTRAQVDQLLKQTQLQAEELQERQEEMRAINEELEVQAENLRVANLELQAQSEQLRSFEQGGQD
jgi:putative methionine-R-sulfoxide reductase with GAF domain